MASSIILQCKIVTKRLNKYHTTEKKPDKEQ